MLVMKRSLNNKLLIFFLNKIFLKYYTKLLSHVLKYMQAKEEEVLQYKGRKNGDNKRPYDNDCGASKEGGGSCP